MKLKRVKIENFRSIESVDLIIEEDVTTLVGANEHGKSNILEALALLGKGTSFDIQKDKRIDGDAKKYCPNIKFTLELEHSERKNIQETVQDKYPPISISKEDGTTEEG